MNVDMKFDVQVEDIEKGKTLNVNLEADNKSLQDEVHPWRRWWLKVIEIASPYVTILVLAILVFCKFGGCCQCKCAEVMQKTPNNENTPNTDIPSDAK